MKVPNDVQNILLIGNGVVGKDLNLAYRVDETDEFDLVVRMNECKIFPYHDRIGWRTDIYTFCARQTMVEAHSMCKEIWWWQNKKQMEALLSEDNPYNFLAAYKLLEQRGVIHNHFYDTDISARKDYREKRAALTKQLGEPKSLSCGIAILLACEVFLGYSNFKINIAGYDGGKSGHIWDEKGSINYIRHSKHFFTKEFEWLREQHKLGNINIIE